MIIAYYINRVLFKKIKPYNSIGHYILFALLNFIAFISLFLVLAILILLYKDFFFT